MNLKYRIIILFLSALALFACKQNGDDSIRVKRVEVVPSKTTLFLEETLRLRASVTPPDAVDKQVVWSSDNPSVATVSEIGLVTAVSEGVAIISATAGGVEGTCRVRVLKEDKPEIDVVSVSIDPPSVTLVYGEGTTLVATVSPENATHPSVTWSSSDDSVVAVSEDGVLTTVKAGFATVKATASNGVEGECAVTVEPFPAFKVQRYNRRTDAWVDAVSAGIYGFPGDSVSVRIVVLRDDGEVGFSVSPSSAASYSGGKVWLNAPGEGVLKASGEKGYSLEIPLHSNISGTFYFGDQAKEMGATLIMGNNSESTVTVKYSDGNGLLSVPARAYDLTFDSQGLVELVRGNDSWTLRTGINRGNGKVNLKVGSWVDTELCTVIVTDDYTTGGTEPVNEFEIGLD